MKPRPYSLASYCGKQFCNLGAIGTYLYIAFSNFIFFGGYDPIDTFALIINCAMLLLTIINIWNSYRICKSKRKIHLSKLKIKIITKRIKTQRKNYLRMLVTTPCKWHLSK